MTQRFFDYMRDEHGLTLLKSEMCEIMIEALKAQEEITAQVKAEQEKFEKKSKKLDPRGADF